MNIWTHRENWNDHKKRIINLSYSYKIEWNFFSVIQFCYRRFRICTITKPPPNSWCIPVQRRHTNPHHLHASDLLCCYLLWQSTECKARDLLLLDMWNWLWCSPLLLCFLDNLFLYTASEADVLSQIKRKILGLTHSEKISFHEYFLCTIPH